MGARGHDDAGNGRPAPQLSCNLAAAPAGGHRRRKGDFFHEQLSMKRQPDGALVFAQRVGDPRDRRLAVALPPDLCG
jgi:hypothetical protein